MSSLAADLDSSFLQPLGDKTVVLQQSTVMNLHKAWEILPWQTEVAYEGALISRLDPRASEKLPEGVLPTLCVVDSNRKQVSFSASHLVSQYLQKRCKYHLIEMLLLCSCGLAFIVCLLFFYSRFSRKPLIG